MARSTSAAVADMDVATTTLSSHKGAVNAAVFNSDGGYCMTGGDDRRVLLWNPWRETADAATAPFPIKDYSAHNQRVLDIAIAKDDRSFASCGGDKTVFVWDVGSGRVLRRLVGHEQRVNAVAYAAECSVLLSASYDTTVRCWDCRSRNAAPIQVLADHADSVSSVAVCAHEIITGSIDGCARAYDLRVGKMLLYGAMLGCIDPVLTIAAASSLSRPLFLAPFDKRQEAAAAHAPFRGEMSDQLGLLRAFEGWSAAQRHLSHKHATELIESRLMTSPSQSSTLRQYSMSFSRDDAVADAVATYVYQTPAKNSLPPGLGSQSQRETQTR